MENRIIPAFTGGLNEVANPKLLQEGVNVELINYQTEGTGVLSLRTKEEEFEEIPSYINPVMIWTWIPVVYPEGHEKDICNYVLLIYSVKDVSDNNEPVYERKLFLLIKKTKTEDDEEIEVWENYLDDQEALFENISTPRITITTNGLALCDGRDNSVIKYIRINYKGRVYYGDISLSGSAKPARVTSTSRAGGSHIDIGTHVPAGAALFYTYTLVMKDGTESRHAPISVYDSDMFQRLDPELQIDEYYRSIDIENLSSSPINDKGMLSSELEFIHIYRAHSLYTQGAAPRTEFRMCKRIPIKHTSTSDSSSLEGNVLELGQSENIKADDITEAGNVLFLANINSSIDFPYSFNRYMPIVITNENSLNYVNKVFRFNLKQSDILNDDNEQDLPFTEIINQAKTAIKGDYLPKLRIYDSDLTTPLSVGYEVKSDGLELALWVKIPYLPANTEYPIYFCYVRGDSPGVTDVNDTLGEFSKTLPDFGNDYLRSEQALITMPGIENLNNQVNLNVVNQEEYVFPTDYEIVDDIEKLYLGVQNITEYDFSEDGYGIKLIKTDNRTPGNSGLTMGYVHQGLPVGLYIGNSLTVAGYFRFNVALVELGDIPRNNCVWSFRKKVGENNRYAVSISVIRRNYGGGEKCYLCYQTRYENDSKQVDIGELPASLISGNYFSAYLVFTYDRNYDTKGAFITYIINPATAAVVATYVNDYEIPSEHKERRPFADIDSFNLGGFKEMHDKYSYTVKELTFSNLYVGREFLRNDVEGYNKKRILHWASFLPDFPTSWIGCTDIKFMWNNTNENIHFETVKENVYDRPTGIIKWSSLSNFNFPGTNELNNGVEVLRIIPAPSYLHNGEYINSIVIFGANGERKRFILQGSPEGWQATLNDLLVREHSMYGLISRGALTMVGETLFWLSPNGLLMESSEGLKNLSDGIIKLPDWEMKSPTISYVPKDNQLLIYDGIEYDLIKEKIDDSIQVDTRISLKVGTFNGTSRNYLFTTQTFEEN